MINSLELKNFTAFRDLKIDFSSKVNVIIGENGIGKTHLLKAAYALCSAPDKTINNTSDVTNEITSSYITKKFIDIFLPLDNKISKLPRTGSEGAAEGSCTILKLGKYKEMFGSENVWRASDCED